MQAIDNKRSLSPVRRPSPFALLRFWLSEHDFIRILAPIALLLGLGFGAYFFPLGPSEDVVGVVQSVSLGASRTPAYRNATVRLGPASVMVDVPPNTCAVGERIHLTRQRRLWGYSILAGPLSCNPPEAGDRPVTISPGGS